mgnify:FL=1|tara:strand:- start:2250 stop:2717 length:468 start_codon:yes stop_codon:yes gene_type:complete
MKKLKYFIILFFLISCGYTPIYQSDRNLNLKLDTINYSGDKKLGRSIIKSLQKLRNNKSINIFDLDFVSSKSENVVSKDKKGNISTYKMILVVNFNLKSKNNNKVFSKKFAKETNFNSMNNKFELSQYKLNLERNLTSQILQDINIFLRAIGNDL